MSLASPASSAIDGAPFRIGIAAARFNEKLVDALLQRVHTHLRAAGVREKKLIIVRVPGSNELPVAVHLLARSGKFDALIALGVLIRGDTLHFEFIADAATHALQRVALDAGIPVINGIIVAENSVQAEARCLGKIGRGAEFARAALEMAVLKRSLGK
ncbi:MAG TPA: 6,7-dimethyl-8-ribityllumazine synthase [Opitutaceae bacterium]|jgi:6,7-dimethyl-8-ribityllumazine synthase|nr:6,7-dimethyl-8-ribityllumazine synthase [Opitutaceae bacterium]